MTIITLEQEEEIRADGRTIRVVPAWKEMLSRSCIFATKFTHQ